MTFADYLEEVGLNPSQFAQQHSLPRAVVYRWARGEVPRAKNLAKLIKLTEGKVTLEAMLGEGGERSAAS